MRSEKWPTLFSFQGEWLETRDLEKSAENNRKSTEAERVRIAELDAKRAEEMGFATASLAHGLKSIAAGDLTFKFNEPFAPDYEALRADFNAASGNCAMQWFPLLRPTTAIDDGSRELSQAANDLSKRTEQQAAALEETAAALDEITVNVTALRRGHRKRAQSPSPPTARAENREVVAEAVDAMKRIETSSNKSRTSSE